MFDSWLKTGAARRIYRNTLFLSAGSIITKIMGFTAVAYMIREMSSSDYGRYSTVVEFVAIFAIFADFGIDMTVLRDGSRARSIEEFQNSIFPLRLSLTVVAFISAVVFALLLPYSGYLRILIIVTAASMFLGYPAALVEHFNSTFRLTEHMKYISAIQIVRMMFYVALMFSTIRLMGAKPHTMLFCLLTANIFGFLLRWRVSRRFVRYRFKLRIDRQFAAGMMRTAKWFGTSYIIYFLIVHLNFQMLYHFTNEDEVAYFSLAWVVVGGLMIFTGAFSTAVYPHSSRNVHRPEYIRKFLKVSLTLSGAAAALALVVNFTAPFVIPVIFESRYESAVLPLSILIWFVPLRIMLQFGNTLLECADRMLEKQVAYIIVLPFNLVLNYFFINEHGAVGAALALIVSLGAMVLMIDYFALRYYRELKTNKETPPGLPGS